MANPAGIPDTETIGSSGRTQPAQFDASNVATPRVTGDPGVRAVPPPTNILSAVPALQQSATNAVKRADAQFQNDIASAGRAFEALYQRRQQLEDKAFADDYQLEYNKRASQITAESLNSPASATPTFVQTLDQRLAQAQQDTFDAMKATGRYSPSDAGIAAARSSAMSIRATTARGAAVTANNQRVVMMVDAAHNNIVTIARDAAATGDLTGGLARASTTVNNLQGVLSPKAWIALRDAMRKQITADVARGYVERGEWDKVYALTDQNRAFTGVYATVAEAAQRYGVPPAWLTATVKVESNGNPIAAPQINPQTGKPSSSARGLFQFTGDTAVRYGLPRNAAAATPEQQADAGARFARDNITALRQTLGRDPTAGEYYLMHMLGSAKAVAAIRANPDQPVGAVLSAVLGAHKAAAVISANPTIYGAGRTAHDVLDLASVKMMEGGAGVGFTAPVGDNFITATSSMHLTPQEQFLYQMHLHNLWSDGGVNNLGPDGQVESRSTLFQAVVEHDGQFYNIPTVWNGQKLAVDDAVKQVEAIGWDKFPSYDSAKEADARYQAMHSYMEKDTGQWFKQRQLHELSDQGRFMDESTRQQLFSAAVKGQRAEMERQQKAAERMRKEVGDAYLKEAYDRANGLKLDANHQQVPLTSDFIEAAKPFVTPAQYKGLVEMQANPTQHDNAEALISLTERESTMAPDVFDNYANTLLRNHLITNKTYTAAIGRNRSAMEKGGPGTPYKFGLDYIKRGLDPGQFGGSGGRNPVTAAAYRNAIADFDTWAQTFQNQFKRPMTQDDAYRMAHYVVDHYQLFDTSQMRISIGRSRYFDKDPKAITVEDMQRYDQQFAADWRAGKYTPLEARMEADRLNSWWWVIETEHARQGQRPTRPPDQYPDFTKPAPAPSVHGQSVQELSQPTAGWPSYGDGQWPAPTLQERWPDETSGAAAAAAEQPTFEERWQGGRR